MRVLFILPGSGGGGGAHSVAQESLGLQRLGAQIGIATTKATLPQFRVNYPELERAGVALCIFDKPEDLAPHLNDYDIACATTWESVHALSAAGKNAKTLPKMAYYVQDYEPLFYAPGTAAWDGARRSYTELPTGQLFAKTSFLCDIVAANHGKVVEKVSPSIDHGIYYPGSAVKREKLTISAMLRPKTPRRAPRRTVRIMEQLAERYGDSINLVTFGCEKADLDERGFRLSAFLDRRGPLSREGVADVLRGSDMFLDLSDYQAFGRTGLEGMACGCVPVLPIFGGADEYMQNRVNGYVVDTRSDAEILNAVQSFVDLDAKTRARMRQAAIRTSLDYTIDKAAFSEYALFQQMLGS